MGHPYERPWFAGQGDGGKKPVVPGCSVNPVVAEISTLNLVSPHVLQG
jgi:hypothetical protein